MGGGRLLTPFPHATDASTDVSTDARPYPHLFDFFGNFKDLLKNLGAEQMKYLILQSQKMKIDV